MELFDFVNAHNSLGTIVHIVKVEESMISDLQSYGLEKYQFLLILKKQYNFKSLGNMLNVKIDNFKKTNIKLDIGYVIYVQ